MLRVGPWSLLSGSAAIVATLWGCGPSVQSIHEGNVRFEHCYRLDLDPNIAPTHRLTCWRQWTEAYAYGQTRDKIDYARRRARYLAAGTRTADKLDLSEKTHTEPATESPAGAPAPTSAHAPPPPMATKPDPGTAARDGGKRISDSGPPAELPDPPFAGCLDSCRDVWRACQWPCAVRSERPDASCSDCKPNYRACLKRCLE